MDEKAQHTLWQHNVADIFRTLNSSAAGLDHAEAAKRLAIQGNNEIVLNKKGGALSMFFRQLKNPLIIILLIVTAVSFFLGEKIDSIIILALVVINSLLGFLQEYRAEKALEKLKKFIVYKAKVLRDGKVEEIDTRLLVQGDLVYLNMGDIVPADMRLIEEHGLSVNQSVLTGESVPVGKNVTDTEIGALTPQNIKNGVFMGTTVLSGSAHGIVVGTGKSTFLGQTSEFLGQPDEITDFEKKSRDFSSLLLKGVIVISVVVFTINLLTGKPVIDSLIFGLVLALGITPEIFPVIVSISLSNGAYKLSRHKVIIKRLDSLEDFGNIDMLCSDKTGTLTEGILRLKEFLDIEEKRNEDILKYSLICNAYNPATKNKILKDAIDKSIWESMVGSKFTGEISRYQIPDLTNFDFDLKRMSVLADLHDGRKIIVKGATEAILKISREIYADGKKLELTPKNLELFAQRIKHYESEGYKVIAVAEKKADKLEIARTEHGFTILGFLLFLDMPKKTARVTLDRIEALGISLKLITGDSEAITRRICEEVGLPVNSGKIVTAADLENISESQFEMFAEQYNVFAGVTPEQKFRIIELLRKKHVVGFLGDGINDVGGLKAAHVGITVDHATDVAKEAADIILLQRDLNVIADGIVEGRKIFANILKSILNLMSSSYGNVFTIGITSFVLKFFPILPTQLLFINLLTDAPHLTISADNVDQEEISKPTKWDLKFLSKFMISFGLISSGYDLIFIFLSLNVLNLAPEVFRTGWVLESILTELVVTFSIRTRHFFFSSRPGRLLLFANILAAILALLAIYSPVGSSLLSFVALTPGYLLLILTVIVCYFFTVEIFKRRFFRKNG